MNRFTGLRKETHLLEKKIQNFNEKGDNSRITSDAKKTLTKINKTKTKRDKLYQKFSLENPDINLYHTSFWRCKLFWVTHLKDSDR